MSARRALATGLAVAVASLLAGGHARGGTPVEVQSRAQPGAPAGDTAAFLAARGIAVTTGAAPGYVSDGVCADCHQDVAASYAAVGMARTLARPRRETAIEAFGVSFDHAASHQRFRMEWRGDRLVFQRWLLDDAGRAVHELEQPVDWVLGSGNHARTYLYRTPSGELWQLPLAWYAQERRWGMAPGFDRGDHEGVLRQVQRECLVCHDAYPQLQAGDDRFGMPHRFPDSLAEGIGCQRCHGPGAEHVRRARDPQVPTAAAIAAIVDPSRLPPERRADVCNQCHLQPAVALPSVRRFERGDLAFVAGEPLAAHRVEMDAREAGRADGERFEINHAAYRLGQSRCAQASGAALGCTSCHDPHRKPSREQLHATVRAVCVGCHAPERCPVAARAGHAAAAAADCATCHMPARRPEDVVHVTVTDHRIAIYSEAERTALVAPRAERDPVLVDAVLLHPEELPRAVAAVYRAVAVLRIGGGEALPALAALLRAAPADAAAALGPEPWLRLAQAQLQRGRPAEAAATLQPLVPQVPRSALARTWLALAVAGEGRTAEALAMLQEATALDPLLAEAAFDRGRLLLLAGRAREALPDLERAVTLRPNLPQGWVRLGEAREALGRRDAAIAAYERAIAVDPGQTAAHADLARALRARRDSAGAAKALALGRRFARDPAALAPR